MNDHNSNQHPFSNDVTPLAIPKETIQTICSNFGIAPSCLKRWMKDDREFFTSGATDRSGADALQFGSQMITAQVAALRAMSQVGDAAELSPDDINKIVKSLMQSGTPFPIAVSILNLAFFSLDSERD